MGAARGEAHRQRASRSVSGARVMNIAFSAASAACSVLIVLDGVAAPLVYASVRAERYMSGKSLTGARGAPPFTSTWLTISAGGGVPGYSRLLRLERTLALSPRQTACDYTYIVN